MQSTCPQIRALFVTILVFCQTAGPRSLSDRFYPSWTDDFHNKARRRGLTLQEEQAKILVLDDLQFRADEITHKFTELQKDVFDMLLKTVKEDSS